VHDIMFSKKSCCSLNVLDRLSLKDIKPNEMHTERVTVTNNNDVYPAVWGIIMIPLYMIPLTTKCTAKAHACTLQLFNDQTQVQAARRVCMHLLACLLACLLAFNAVDFHLKHTCMRSK
jgi:hypothetical protein